MLVRITKPASIELEQIANYIAMDNPTRANSFVLELLSRCGALADHPQRYPLLRESAHAGVRRCAFGNYLIFYRVREDIEVLHILNSAMDYRAILGAEQ